VVELREWAIKSKCPVVALVRYRPGAKQDQTSESYEFNSMKDSRKFFEICSYFLNAYYKKFYRIGDRLKIRPLEKINVAGPKR